MEIGADLAPAVEHLLHAYPAYVTIEDLPLSELDEKVENYFLYLCLLFNQLHI